MTGQARCKFWQHVKRTFSEVADDIRRVDVPVDERMSGHEEFVGASTQLCGPSLARQDLDGLRTC